MIKVEKTPAEENPFDFGFTADDSIEIIVSKSSDDLKNLAIDCLEKLYKEFSPLLTNLEKNPEKPTINWPDRAKKIDEFRTKLLSLKTDLKNDIKRF